VVLPVTSHVDSLAPGDQIRSLDKTRLRSRIGTLSAEDLAAVEEALLITLGIGRT